MDRHVGDNVDKYTKTDKEDTENTENTGEVDRLIKKHDGY